MRQRLLVGGVVATAIGGSVGVGWLLDHAPRLGYPLYEPGASFLPAVAPAAMLLALLLGIARRGRGPVSVLLFQSLLAFVGLVIAGATGAYVFNGAADRAPAARVPFRVAELGDGRSGPFAWIVPGPGWHGAPTLTVPARRLGDPPPRVGGTVWVHVRPGALGRPWIERYEVPGR